MKTAFQRFVLALALAAATGAAAPTQAVHFFRDALYSGPLGGRGFGRSAVFANPVFHSYVVGDLKPPRAGEKTGAEFRGRAQTWRRVEADADGNFARGRLRGGYLYFTCDLKAPETVILLANGCSELLVNGVPRAGDVYGKGWMLLPAHLKAGRNEFWFAITRGKRRSLSYILPTKPVYLTDVDMTVPDFLTTEIDDKLAAIRVVNATDRTLEGLTIQSSVAGQIRTTKVADSIGPMTTRKIPFTVRNVSDSPGKQAVAVSLLQNGRLLDRTDITLDVKEPTEAYRRTFISKIDGSLQYYAVHLGRPAAGQKTPLIFSLHGAGVEALAEARAYHSTNWQWADVVAPTNRRPFGFDWEDWGRLDALEVLGIVRSRFDFDPDRTYLQGHSMGGHGTWYLGATYPGNWAAIVPQSGWRSFFTYTGKRAYEKHDAVAAMLNRATSPSHTLDMVKNYLQFGIFIEHGQYDHNVPVSEGRAMRQLLGTFHPDFEYHEEPGAGHWYGVDHKRIFDFMRNHVRTSVRDIAVLHFRSACPGISSTDRYITLYQQEKPYEFCGVVAKQTIRSRRQRRHDQEIDTRKYSITTENLKTFRIDLSDCRGFKQVSVEVDGQAIAGLPWPAKNDVWLEREGGKWTVIPKPDDARAKNPARYGGFKDAFRHDMVFVYGTGGNAQENAWAYDKARFDAETFYYRGNGSIDVIPDTAFTLSKYKDRSVIIYGNSTTNKVWTLLLDESPVQVSRGELRIGDKILKGDDYGVYMVRPREDSRTASVGVVAGTGMPGCRAVVPNRYFESGTGFPDLMVVSPAMYSKGIAGVVAAGYFGNDWSLKHGDIAWSKLSTAASKGHE